MLIYPSMLSADPTKLGDELLKVEKAGADSIHWDIMDGVFVDAITFGHHVVKAHRKFSSLRFDVHLMIENPEKHIEKFSLSGADVIIIHPETCKHLHSAICTIKSFGKKSGIALNPATPPNILEYCLDIIDIVVVMGVNPGSSGQNFIGSQLQKISELRKVLPGSTEICIDGGITDKTIVECKQCGGDSFVSGSYIFKNMNYFHAIQKLKASANEIHLI